MSEAADFVAKAASIRGTLQHAIILGSGLGGVTRILSDARTISYADIPGFPLSTTSGHAGYMAIGFMGGAEPQCFLAGRSHYYEGCEGHEVAFAMRTLRELGVQQVLLCSAAGGIAERCAPGSLMLVNDILNFSFRNPLIGPPRPGEARFPDMGAPFDKDMNARLRIAADSNGLTLHDGVYAGVLGPSYETPAEIRMLRTLGADAVGMSTVPEVIVARANGLRVAALCCITNRASGLKEGHSILSPLSHEDVIRVARESEAALGALLLRASALSAPPGHPK